MTNGHLNYIEASLTTRMTTLLKAKLNLPYSVKKQCNSAIEIEVTEQCLEQQIKIVKVIFFCKFKK